MNYRTVAKATFPRKGNSKKIFLYLNQIRLGFGNGEFTPAEGIVLYSYSRQANQHLAEVKVASSMRDYELATTRDFLVAIEQLGATVEYL